MEKKKKRGRPKKERPAVGGGLAGCTSLRDIAAVTGASRRFLTQAKLVGSISEAEFEELIESDNPPNARQLELLARRRAGKSTMYIRRCPHCGKPLRIEDA
jgi:hypothetical protein